MRWHVLKSDYVFSCPWLKIRKDHVRQPSGHEIEDFYVVEQPDWVNIVAITPDERFIIEEQYRHGISQVCYELPAGMVEEGEDPLVAARRELLEETGCESDDWQPFGMYVPNASGSTIHCYTFVARNVRQVAEPQFEESEDIKLHRYTKQQLITIMEQGLMPEAVMQAPIWKLINNII